MKKKVLYIEDELFLGKIVKETLEKFGYEVHWETDGARVMSAFDNFIPDICVVDIMLPNIDGYTLGRNIRRLFPGVPVIFLTAKTTTDDLVKGFNSGGTDYMKKPFSIEELVARIENQLSLAGNSNKETKSKEMILLGSYRFWPLQGELHHDGDVINLSHRDTQVLTILASGRNRIIDRKELLIAVWGDDSFFNSRTLDVYIRKIRCYLSADPSIEIKTLKGKGYLFLVG
ncbi:MAG: response regulator transcription factor [Bacteroidia bacterium]|nr:MAG: response regulator transcription factor [Bacteroidia bacterium]